jgi:D-aminopeptidase
MLCRQINRPNLKGKMSATSNWNVSANNRARARSLGLTFAGVPGFNNSITDVPGVAVGYTTKISGEGALIVGRGPVRTGVTAILPRGKAKAHIPCHAASFSLNGNGEMTGLAWIEEAGLLQTPITITNTHSCGVTRDATLQWMFSHGIGSGQDWGLPVAAETYDGELNDLNGFHVTVADTFHALDTANTGSIAMGNVGGGTGMITYDFKGGSSTSSRLMEIDGQTFTLGIFVQSNFGKREHLTILGVPVGQHLRQDKLRGRDVGSIIAFLATDAPLLPHQLKRLARRIPLGLARTGTTGGNGSGDIFLAFSTANAAAYAPQSGSSISAFDSVHLGAMDLLFEATVEATEEAVIDAMITGETMIGRDQNRCIALPHDQLLSLLHNGHKSVNNRSAQS